MLQFASQPLECLPSGTAPARVCGSALIAAATSALVLSRPQWPQRKAAKMEATCMNQIELANRWKLSPRTLERWRWLGQGPQYLKIGGRVIYRVVDIEEYELAMIRYAKSDISHSQPSFA
jgi:hypothetical protein